MSSFTRVVNVFMSSRYQVVYFKQVYRQILSFWQCWKSITLLKYLSLPKQIDRKINMNDMEQNMQTIGFACFDSGTVTHENIWYASLDTKAKILYLKRQTRYKLTDRSCKTRNVSPVKTIMFKCKQNCVGNFLGTKKFEQNDRLYKFKLNCIWIWMYVIQTIAFELNN